MVTWGGDAGPSVEFAPKPVPCETANWWQANEIKLFKDGAPLVDTG